MSTKYSKARRAWSDKLMPQVKEILMPYLIKTANDYDDQANVTDIKTKECSVAVRIRGAKQIRYRKQFTMRIKYISKFEGELEKIINGDGDLYFYGIASDTRIVCWYLIDLPTFRMWYKRIEATTGKAPGKLVINKDGLTAFRSFSFLDLPATAIVASYEEPGIDRTAAAKTDPDSAAPRNRAIAAQKAQDKEYGISPWYEWDE